MASHNEANNFDNPLSATIYDIAEGSREDLDAYRAIVDELKAHVVIDIGCGTGVFALDLAERGYRVIGLDPAGAMLDIAKAKPGAEKVEWIHGPAEKLTRHDATHQGEGVQARSSLTPERGHADVALMTGNVAQVFLTDDEWLSTLRAIHDSLVPGGHLVFETRIPERQAWKEWAHQGISVFDVPGVGEVRDIFKLLAVDEPFVTFSADMTLPDGSVVPSQSTLIFRTMADLERTLSATGFVIREVRDAPDRPGMEWVVMAQRE